MNLAGYLARIGVAPPVPPTAETLRRIHVAHLAAFPFHNLTIQRGGVVRVDVDSIAEKFFAPGGGGYCFEQNTLLAAALRDLGFEVTTLLARVGGPTLDHMLLRVDIDGKPWLADAGFGGEGPLEPIPLEDGVRVTEEGIDFSLGRDGQEWTLSMHYDGVTEQMYRFTEMAFTAGDVEMANHYTSTWPDSIFRHTLTIQRVTAEERLILRPKMLTRYRKGVRTDTPIEPDQIRRFARELFGIDLDEGRMLFEQDQPAAV